jgi:bifunctional non-homologous end joining protein LigD
MKAAIGALPHDDERWAYEIKWDGYRMIAFVDDHRVRLQSSSGIDMISTYPELAGLHDDVNAASAIIDGEIVVLDADGRPSFEMLQRHDTQVAFYAFDVLQVNGDDTIALPYEQRRDLLGHLLEPGPNWMVPVAGVAVIASESLEDDEAFPQAHRGVDRVLEPEIPAGAAGRDHPIKNVSALRPDGGAVLSRHAPRGNRHRSVLERIAVFSGYRFRKSTSPEVDGRAIRRTTRASRGERCGTP